MPNFLAKCSLCLLLCLGAGMSSAAEAPLSLALKQAAQDGRPVLAICGREECPLCQAFKQYLRTDQSVRAMVSNYIVVNVDVDSNSSGYMELAQRNPLKGKMLPFVYVLRADGQVIQGVASAKGDGSVAPMLREGLAKSGKLISPKDAARYASALKKAEQAFEQDNPALALTMLAPAMKAQGFAEPLAQSQELVEKIAKQATNDIDECDRMLEDADKLLAVAVLSSDSLRKYGKLPEQKKALTQVVGKIKRKDGGAAALAQAQEIVKARGYARAGHNDRAADVYKKLIEKNPSTPIAELAETEMKALAEKPNAAESKDSDKEGKRTARANP
jgi:tetratricopeptide (TPR) repeat protein